MTELKTQVADSKNAESLGFAQFNGGPHLLVDVPNGHFTISTKTSQGKRVTFAFCPYEKDGPAQCIDIEHHNSERVVMNGVTPQAVQTVICFSQGNDAFRGYTDAQKPVTLTTLLLHSQDAPEKQKQTEPKASPAELVRLISSYASAVVEATKRQGMGKTANKKELATAKSLMKGLLGRMPTDDEVNSIIAQ